jgi:hypothetical protein
MTQGCAAPETGPGPDLRAHQRSSPVGLVGLIGNDVYNEAAEELGRIRDIMVSQRDGRVCYVALAFAGPNAKLFAVPWNALRLDETLKRLVLDVDRSRLELAPGFDPRHWPDAADQVWELGLHGID